MFSTNVPVWTEIPWRLRPRSTTFEMSASSVGQHAVERLKSSVTVEPRRA